jgi:hypothetical protein
MPLQPENVALLLQFSYSAWSFSFAFSFRTGYTDFSTFSIPKYSSVPTNNQVLIPETLLKKRKSQEQARAARTAELEEKKKVSFGPVSYPRCFCISSTSAVVKWGGPFCDDNASQRD